MALIICISDYWQHKTYYKLISNANNDNSIDETYSLEILQTIKRQNGSPNAIKLPVFQMMKRLKWNIDAIDFFYFNKELLYYSKYRKLLCTEPNFKSLKLLWLQIVPPARDIIDWKW